jgi:dTDP-4-dehydrorhamnose reductase
MKILITGAKGQVGSELVLEAEKRGHDVYSFTSSELDITNCLLVNDKISSIKPCVVINAAAYTSVDKAEEEKQKAYTVNELGVKNLAESCKKLDIPLLHISTDYVFDGDKKESYVETDTPNPTSVYGASKRAGEIALQNTWVKHIILRVSWVFGEHGNNFVKTMLRLAKDSNELSVVNDQFGAPTAAIDIAKALLDLAIDDKKDFGVYHLESNPNVSWHGFAQKIFEQAKVLGLIKNIPLVNAINSSQFKTPVKRPANSKLATTKGLPAVTWTDALSKMLKDMSA